MKGIGETKDLSRRLFLKGVASVAVGAAGLSVTGCTGETPVERPAYLPDEWAGEADIIIIGAGGAGLSAGITVMHEKLGTALILEAAPEGEEGGNSRVCAQILFIPDGVEGAVTYQTNLNGAYVVERELLTAWATELVQNVEWLNELGADMQSVPLFAPEYPDVVGSETAKCYGVGGMAGLGNSGAWNFLKETAEDLKVEIRYESRVVELIFDPASKEVFGVKTQDGRSFKAKKGVILSCGGFENNPNVMKTYYPAGYPDVGYVGTPYNRGEGILMAQQIGAELWHMNSFAGPYFGCQAFPSYTGELAGSIPVYYNPMFAAKDFIFIGCDGKRYMNEDTFQQARHGKIFRGGAYVTMPTPTPGWCIFGQQTFDAGDLYGRISSSWTGAMGLSQASTNAEAVSNGIFVKCDTVADIAAATSLTTATIQETIDEWNTCCENDYDPLFHRGEDYFDTVGQHGASAAEEGKPAIPAYPIVRLEAPYYVMQMIGGILNSQGGPKRNANGEIVDQKGNAIARLYGSGELGCIYSYMYNGGGNFSEAISSGRFAARNAAKLTAWDAEPTS
jgi:succinate dehydrogenase/fumarate reductase flavoprotein subunit